VIAPFAVVADVHTLFAFAGRLDDCAVGIDQSFFKELVRLLLPDFQPGLVDRVHQGLNVFFVEASTKVAGRRRIGNALNSQRIQKNFVVTPQFDVFQACAADEQVVGDVEHMIRFVIRQMTFQDMHPLINALSQARALHQQLHHSYTSGNDAARPAGELIVDGVSVEHGPFAFNENVLATEPPLNPTLAVSRSS
jgi:hypothetical protein